MDRAGALLLQVDFAADAHGRERRVLVGHNHVHWGRTIGRGRRACERIFEVANGVGPRGACRRTGTVGLADVRLDRVVHRGDVAHITREEGELDGRRPVTVGHAARLHEGGLADVGVDGDGGLRGRRRCGGPDGRGARERRGGADQAEGNHVDGIGRSSDPSLSNHAHHLDNLLSLVVTCPTGPVVGRLDCPKGALSSVEQAFNLQAF